MRAWARWARVGLLAFAMAWVGLPAAAVEGDPERGRELAINCVGCHGSDGISINDIWPNLAGQQYGYLVRQMRAYRDGDRHDPLMTAWVANLSDQEIDHLAAWFSGLAERCGCE